MSGKYQKKSRPDMAILGNHRSPCRDRILLNTHTF